MSDSKKTILVAGDVTVDWFMYPVGETDDGQNWRLHSSFDSNVLPGGAFLLADFTRAAIAAAGVAADVVSPQIPADLAGVSPEQFVHSNVALQEFPSADGKKAKALRIQKSLGYIGPEHAFPEAPVLTASPEAVDVIILDDAGNGFRSNESWWPKALTSSQDSTVVCKMCRPLADGPLWQHLKTHLKDDLVVVINPEDLRQTRGVHLSHGLSWERTAKDFVYQLQRSESLREL